MGETAGEVAVELDAFALRRLDEPPGAANWKGNCCQNGGAVELAVFGGTS